MLEQHEGPHGELMDEVTSDEADPNNPNGRYRYVAGTPVRDPETGVVEMAATFDWHEKARLDLADKLSGQKPNPMNGAIIPVRRVERVPAADLLSRSPLTRYREQHALPPPPPA